MPSKTHTNNRGGAREPRRPGGPPASKRPIDYCGEVGARELAATIREYWRSKHGLKVSVTVVPLPLARYGGRTVYRHLSDIAQQVAFVPQKGCP
jgi:hypothetical protein